MVEPFIDQAIGIEVQNLINEGEQVDMSEVASYRFWQKGGEVVAGGILGLSFASFFALVYGYTRRSLPGAGDVRKGIFLASILWLTLFLVPFIKYPGNPPAVGDPETIYYRQTLYIVYMAISGFGVLGFAFLYRKLSPISTRKLAVPLMYAAYVAGFYFVMPPNPDQIMIPMDLITSFRVVSAGTMLAFWLMLGTVFGALWGRFRLHVGIRRAAG